jgi:hypothetical protein
MFGDYSLVLPILGKVHALAPATSLGLFKRVEQVQPVLIKPIEHVASIPSNGHSL